MAFCKEYKLFCPTGMEVSILEAGAALTGVRMMDKNGVFANVALPLQGYDDQSLAGVTLAPYAGRVAGGRISIAGVMHQLALNEGSNHIHGGPNAPARKPWRASGTAEGADYQEICFTADAEDGLDGYPGGRRFTATYRLYHDQRLEILLTAVTDKPTRVNLSNHAYFNMSGDFSGDISGHVLEIRAREVYLNDESFLPAGRQELPPALDFNRLRTIGIPYGHPQLDGARGLNHCYVLSGGGPAAVLADPVSGRRMRLYTDQPCLVVYSGGYLDKPNCAIALEAQEHPESPIADETRTLYPGEIYHRRIIYHFDVMPE